MRLFQTNILFLNNPENLFSFSRSGPAEVTGQIGLRERKMRDYIYNMYTSKKILKGGKKG